MLQETPPPAVATIQPKKNPRVRLGRNITEYSPEDRQMALKRLVNFCQKKNLYNFDIALQQQKMMPKILFLMHFSDKYKHLVDIQDAQLIVDHEARDKKVRFQMCLAAMGVVFVVDFWLRFRFKLTAITRTRPTFEALTLKNFFLPLALTGVGWKIKSGYDGKFYEQILSKYSITTNPTIRNAYEDLVKYRDSETPEPYSVTNELTADTQTPQLQAVPLSDFRTETYSIKVS